MSTEDLQALQDEAKEVKLKLEALAKQEQDAKAGFGLNMFKELKEGLAAFNIDLKPLNKIVAFGGVGDIVGKLVKKDKDFDLDKALVEFRSEKNITSIKGMLQEKFGIKAEDTGLKAQIFNTVTSLLDKIAVGDDKLVKPVDKEEVEKLQARQKEIAEELAFQKQLDKKVKEKVATDAALEKAKQAGRAAKASGASGAQDVEPGAAGNSGVTTTKPNQEPKVDANGVEVKVRQVGGG